MMTWASTADATLDTTRVATRRTRDRMGLLFALFKDFPSQLAGPRQGQGPVSLRKGLAAPYRADARGGYGPRPAGC